MKKLYQKPVVYSEQLTIDSLRALCCKQDQECPDEFGPMPEIPDCRKCNCTTTNPSV